MNRIPFGSAAKIKAASKGMGLGRNLGFDGRKATSKTGNPQGLKSNPKLVVADQVGGKGKIF